MSNDERAFLAAIHAQPDDNLPRLVYADWLDDQGEGERAAFIRLQCGLVSENIPSDIEQQVERWEPFVKRWAKSLMPAGWEPGLTRGLPERLSCPAREFLEHGPAILAVLPIDSLWLCDHAEVVRDVAMMPCMKQIRSIEFSSWSYIHGCLFIRDGQILDAIADSPYFHNLQSMSVCSVQLGVDSAERFAASPWIGQLERLKACCNDEGGDRSLAAYARSVNPERFRSLDLTWNAIGDAGLTAWAESPCTAGVRELNLFGNRVDDAGMIALAESPYARSLRTLEIMQNRYGNSGLTALAQSETLANLERLSLGSDSHTVADGLTALASSTHIQPNSLSLVFDHAPPECWSLLCQSPLVQRATDLHLCGHIYRQTVLEAIFNSPRLDRLQTLQIDNFRPDNLFPNQPNEYGDRFAKRIAKVYALPNLRALTLRTLLGIAGVEALLNCPRFPPGLRLKIQVQDKLPPDLIAAYRERFGATSIAG